MTDVVEAFKKIAAARVPFVSRGDDSGTHRAERLLWREAGIDASAASGTWYRETGSGMGATLNTAASMHAYALSDRATWLSFRNKAELVILVQGDKRLFNQYGVIRVNPARHPHVKAAAAKAFVDWLTSEAGQTAIADFKVDGRQLFFPNAKGLGP
jgi:tungstate transport system substrate-binding protein